jgi:RNA polymerase sigma-70 factor (ECF subfamily)
MLDDREIKALLLLTAARDEGSAEAFERLYKACAPLLLGVAKRVLGRSELAEEVLHDSFAKIWQAADSFDPLAARPVAWMVAIVRNRAIDTLARDVSRIAPYREGAFDAPENALDRLFEWTEGAEEAEDQRRGIQWLRECLDHLPAVDRQALVLAYDRGLSHNELARHFDKPLGTVKSWIRRGMGSLRRCIESRTQAPR